ncbi:MAG: hypothetical protein ACTHLL_06245, partial [Candidatus Nitrosocosmicus sp.]
SDVNSIKSNLNTSKNHIFNFKFSSNFVYLKSNSTFIPLIFLANHENIINNIIYEKDKSSLLLILNPINSANNSIIIQIPRSVIDSKTHDNIDNNFTVSLDNKSSKYLEINSKKNVNGISNFESSINTIGNIFNNSNDRVLLIKFDKDTKVIKIAGEDMSKNQNPIESHNLPKKENPIIMIIITFIIAISLLIIYFFYKRKKIDFALLIKKLKNNKNKTQR